MTMQVQQLPEFNPVAAGYPLTAQGYGPNEMVIDRYRGDLGPTGRWGQQMQSLGQYPYSPYYGLGQAEAGMMDQAKAWVAENPWLALAAGAAVGAGLYYAYQRYAMMSY
jgi:hypothetical protein